MLEHVERVDAVELAGKRAGQHVVDVAGEAPGLVHPGVDVLDEDGIEVDRGEAFHRLDDDAGAEGIPAADFQHALGALQHLGDELVARQREGEALRIVVPGLAGHQPQGFEAALELEQALVLGLAGSGVFRLRAHDLVCLPSGAWPAIYRSG